MIKRKEILNYVTKTKEEEIPKELFINLVKKVYDSVGKCKRCSFYNNEDKFCNAFESPMKKNDYCSLYIKKVPENEIKEEN